MQHRGYRPGGVSPGSLAASLGITGLMVVGMIFAAPHIVRGPDETHLTVSQLPVPPVPPPDPVRVERRTTVPTQITAPRPEVVLPLAPPNPVATLDPPVVPMSADPGIGNSTGPVAEPTPIQPPPPALVAPQVDARYADAFQPPYPAEERRAEREGRVVVRVLVGVDGHVRQVERVSAASDAFFLATQRQALTRWRFKPATRGDVPTEGWKTMAVSFVLRDG